MNYASHTYLRTPLISCHLVAFTGLCIAACGDSNNGSTNDNSSQSQGSQQDDSNDNGTTSGDASSNASDASSGNTNSTTDKSDNSDGSSNSDSGTPSDEISDSSSQNTTSSQDDSQSDETDTGNDESGETSCRLGPWRGNDNVPPSQDPPCNLKPSLVPMFVTLGFDDNDLVEGINFAAQFSEMRNPSGSGQDAIFDASPLSFAFYNTTSYSSTAGNAWKNAYDGGHEMGNHTINHNTSEGTSFDTWQNEMSGCNQTQVGLGMAREDLVGFRTPFLATNDAMLDAVEAQGFIYDTSLEEGFEDGHDRRNFFWPYTLDSGSPGNDILVEWGGKQAISQHPGLWEMPVYAVIAPPDELCEQYGIESGFRDRLLARQSYFDTEGGKITGFDYNLIESTMFGMSNDEYAATLMYTLDLRLEGNRAPLLVATHAKNYGAYQPAIEKFIDYALTKEDVRIVAPIHILDCIRNPTPLEK